MVADCFQRGIGLPMRLCGIQVLGPATVDIQLQLASLSFMQAKEALCQGSALLHCLLSLSLCTMFQDQTV